MSNNCVQPREAVGACTGAFFDRTAKLWLIGTLADLVVVILGARVGNVADVAIIVAIATEIGFEFIPKEAYAAGVLTGAWACASDFIGPEVNASRVAVAMTAVEFAMRAPWEDAFFCSSAPFSCWPTTVLDCVRALQACKPSYHV